LSKILDIREYDVHYQIRAQIDSELRISYWYHVELDGPLLTRFRCDKENHDKAQIRVLAFDIETTKQPLRFPDAKFDQIMMISYIIDGSGFLITNREIVSQDVEDFEYAPREDYDVGLFKVFNEPDERSLIRKFFAHIQETKPTVFTSFNGDKFDWPFIQQRAEHHHLSMEKEIGIFYFEAGEGEYTGRFSSHLDCLYWVKRDAFLPQGSHGLKAVTKAKLGYDPVELDPEKMTPYA
jgi:DNA polymerase epsilon subunit 1